MEHQQGQGQTGDHRQGTPHGLDAVLHQRLARCERQNQRLWRVVIGQGVAGLALVLSVGTAMFHAPVREAGHGVRLGSADAGTSGIVQASYQADGPAGTTADTTANSAANRPAGHRDSGQVVDSITAREILVVDAQGTIRARMSGDMPDAVMAGGRVARRGTKAAGFMIYDEEGIERGGYVTMDTGSNAMLSLDSKHHMVAHMVVGPGTGESEASALRLGGTPRALEFRVDPNGARMSTEANRQVVSQSPEIFPLSAATCQQMHEYEKQYPGKNVCRARYTEAACGKCLSGK